MTNPVDRGGQVSIGGRFGIVGCVSSHRRLTNSGPFGLTAKVAWIAEVKGAAVFVVGSGNLEIS